jgi:hypothetical protein
MDFAQSPGILQARRDCSAPLPEILQFPAWSGKSRNYLSDMDDRSNAAKKSKKSGGILRGLVYLIKRSKPANAHPNSTRPGNDIAASAEPTPSGKYLSVIYDDSTSLQVAMVRTVLNSYLEDLADSAHHPDPTTPFRSARPSPSSSTPDLPVWLGGSSQGEITRL